MDRQEVSFYLSDKELKEVSKIYLSKGYTIEEAVTIFLLTSIKFREFPIMIRPDIEKRISELRKELSEK